MYRREIYVLRAILYINSGLGWAGLHQQRCDDNVDDENSRNYRVVSAHFSAVRFLVHCAVNLPAPSAFPAGGRAGFRSVRISITGTPRRMPVASRRWVNCSTLIFNPIGFWQRLESVRACQVCSVGEKCCRCVRISFHRRHFDAPRSLLLLLLLAPTSAYQGFLLLTNGAESY